MSLKVNYIFTQNIKELLTVWYCNLNDTFNSKLSHTLFHFLWLFGYFSQHIYHLLTRLLQSILILNCCIVVEKNEKQILK
jgi:hypothetical protein